MSWLALALLLGCGRAHDPAGGDDAGRDEGPSATRLDATTPLDARAPARDDANIDASTPVGAVDATAVGDAGRDALDAGIKPPVRNERDASETSEVFPVECDGCDGPVRLTKIATGDGHACAITSDARVVCWGNGHYGALGVGADTYEECLAYDPPVFKCRTRPTLVPGLSGVVDVGAGQWHTCAVLDDGTVHCWGANRSGELGIADEGLSRCGQQGLVGDIACSHSPRQVPNLQNVARVAVGGFHNCVLRHDGTVACWGSALGVGAPPGTAPDDCSGTVEACFRRPIEQPLDGEVVALSAGTTNSTVVLEGNRAMQWSLTPATPIEIDDVATAHANNFNCVVTVDDEVSCWGNNQFGQLGYGCTTMTCATPVVVEGFGEIRDFATASAYACSVGPEGEIKCIGQHPAAYALLGDYCAPCSEPPCESCNAPRLLFGPSDVAQLALGNGFLCVLTSDGDFWCSGSNFNGRLGNGLQRNDPDPPEDHCPIGLVPCDFIQHNGCDTPIEECPNP